jgi:DNA-directed RNA polymerase specialized sigma24 family protein
MNSETNKRLDILYRKHHEWLMKVAYNLSKDTDVANDLVGELYIYLGEKDNEKLYYLDSFNLKYCHLFLSSRFYNKCNRDKKMVITDSFTDDMDDEYDYDGDNRLEQTWDMLKQELEELKQSKMWSSAKLYEMYQFQDMTMEELSKKIGISKSTTFLNIKKIREHLKNTINNPFDE